MTSETDYAVAPGEYLAEWLEDRQVTQQQAADRLGCSRKQVNDIVHGRAPITADTALKLEHLTSIPADSWTRFEAQYRTNLARLRERDDLAQHAAKIPPATATYLRGMKMTTGTMKQPGVLVSDFLTFHGRGTWESFEESVEHSMQGKYSLAALSENKASFNAVACATWLRAGELSDACERGRRFTYDEAALRALLPALRERAASPDPSLLPNLAQMLANVGVVFAMVPPPSGLPLYGMTRWIDERVPVIHQTGRREKDGFIIWTFFHELGHVLNDPRGETHLEFKTAKARTSKAETNANKFAFNLLFGDDGLEPFSGLRSDHAIERVARQVGVSPGVAVHQMHRRRALPYNYGNDLFVPLEWATA